MPNLNPAPDSPATIAVEQELIRPSRPVIDVRPYATISVAREGREVTDLEALKPLAVGFSDDGNGIQQESTMREAMRRVAAMDGIIAAHCEDNSLLHGGYIHDGEYAAATDTAASAPKANGDR